MYYKTCNQGWTILLESIKVHVYVDASHFFITLHTCVVHSLDNFRTILQEKRAVST